MISVIRDQSVAPSIDTLMIRGVSARASGIVCSAASEVLARHVRLRAVVAEGLDEHELVGIVDAARPVEPQVAGLRARPPW